jgi:hypothetical protein
MRMKGGGGTDQRKATRVRRHKSKRRKPKVRGEGEDESCREREGKEGKCMR